jgi:hypothetical protein
LLSKGGKIPRGIGGRHAVARNVKLEARKNLRSCIARLRTSPVTGEEKGRLTGKNVAAFLNSLLDGVLREVLVVAIVGDNASSMQSGIEFTIEEQAYLARQPVVEDFRDPDAPAEELIEDAADDTPEVPPPVQPLAAPLADRLFEAILDDDDGAEIPAAEGEDPASAVARLYQQRCFAHSLQLLVGDLEKTALADMMTVYEEYAGYTPVKAVETRWNSRFDVVSELIKPACEAAINNRDVPRRLQELHRAYAPFKLATDMVQGNNSSMWDQLAAIETLLNAFSDNSALSTQVRTAMLARAGVLNQYMVFNTNQYY